MSLKYLWHLSYFCFSGSFIFGLWQKLSKLSSFKFGFTFSSHIYCAKLREMLGRCLFILMIPNKYFMETWKYLLKPDFLPGLIFLFHWIHMVIVIKTNHALYFIWFELRFNLLNTISVHSLLYLMGHVLWSSLGFGFDEGSQVF